MSTTQSIVQVKVNKKASNMIDKLRALPRLKQYHKLFHEAIPDDNSNEVRSKQSPKHLESSSRQIHSLRMCNGLPSKS